jgi:methylenetetrahydrofolate dehydrogenase (NADP+)/methenyltetrahydrofolate cyclohydrolase
MLDWQGGFMNRLRNGLDSRYAYEEDRMNVLLKGAPVVAALHEKLTQEMEALQSEGIVPTLAIVRVGDKDDDVAYESSIVKRFEKVGVVVRLVTLPGTVTQDKLLDTLSASNTDETVHGVLLFRPLPKGFDDDLVRNTLIPEKDVDGITDASLTAVFTGSGAGYPPCTPQACMEILEHYNINPQGKKVVVVGRSLVVGKPAAMMLLQRNATVTICHSRTTDMPAVCREGEILIVGIGRAKMIDKSYLAPGQIVIDVGINMLEDGSMCGDVDFDAAQETVASISPVPGGVGTVTTSVLVKHVVEAARKQLEAKQ